MELEQGLKSTYLQDVLAIPWPVPHLQSPLIIQPLDLKEQGSLARLGKRIGVSKRKMVSLSETVEMQIQFSKEELP